MITKDTPTSQIKTKKFNFRSPKIVTFIVTFFYASSWYIAQSTTLGSLYESCW